MIWLGLRIYDDLGYLPCADNVQLNQSHHNKGRFGCNNSNSASPTLSYAGQIAGGVAECSRTRGSNVCQSRGGASKAAC